VTALIPDLDEDAADTDDRPRLGLIIIDEGSKKTKVYAETIGRHVADWIKREGGRRVNIVCVHPEADAVKSVLSAIGAHLKATGSAHEPGKMKRAKVKDVEAWQFMNVQGYYQYMGKFSEVIFFVQ
jgi:hypothetical protein